jgi:hypothetical protein
MNQIFRSWSGRLRKSRMSIEPFGAVVILLGLLALALEVPFFVYLFLISTLLGAAGAIILTSFGSANLSPAHLLLGFLSLKMLIDRGRVELALSGVAFPREGFWLLLTVVYATAGAYIMPRLFEGVTDVFAISRDPGTSTTLWPLHPVTGNVTQTIYFIGDFICFLVFYSFARDARLTRALCHAGILCGVLNLAFVVVDLATYWTGTAELLSFLRNASYRMLDDVEILGLKRIVGSFTEASAFAYASLGLFAFTGKLWLRGIYPGLNGLVALFTLIALLASTSTTAYAGVGILLALEYLGCLRAIRAGRGTSSCVVFAFLGPLLALVAIVMLALDHSSWSFAQDLLNKTLFDKMTSSSGMERSSWNTQTIANFIATSGFGVGVGSTRASSLLFAVLGSLGVFGSITYGIFIVAVLVRRDADHDRFSDSLRAAAQSACLASLIAGCMAASFIDIGLPFFLFAGTAAGLRGSQERRTTNAPGDQLQPEWVG